MSMYEYVSQSERDQKHLTLMNSRLNENFITVNRQYINMYRFSLFRCAGYATKVTQSETERSEHA